jgi:peptide deformylase
MGINVDKMKIVKFPHPVLRQKAKPVDAVTPEIKTLVAKMFELMHEGGKGVGLAAPQVGVSLRIFVTCETQDPKDDRAYINPVLTVQDTVSEDMEEGCLSLPDIRGTIRRPVKLAMDALDIDGQPFHLEDDDYLARIWQHENDHLDGVLIIDRMSLMDRMASKRALKELEDRATVVAPKKKW